MASLEGYSQVRRALAAISASARRELTNELKTAGRRRLVPEARDRAPRASGRLARSVQVFPRSRDIMFGSRRVYAPVQEFGGTIIHHGASHQHGGGAFGRRRERAGAFGRSTRTVTFGKHRLRIKAQPYIYPAIDARRYEVVRDLGDALVDVARRHGINARRLSR